MEIRLSTRRFMASVVYFGSAAFSVASLVRTGCTLDTSNLILNICAVSIWGVSAIHSLYCDYRSFQGERTGAPATGGSLMGLKPATHSLINASLYTASASLYLATDLRPGIGRTPVFAITSTFFWLKSACINDLLSVMLARNPEAQPDENIRLCGMSVAVIALVSEIDCMASGIFDALSSAQGGVLTDILSDVCWMAACLHDLVQAAQIVKEQVRSREARESRERYSIFSASSDDVTDQGSLAVEGNEVLSSALSP